LNKEFASLGLNKALLDNLESMDFKEMSDIQAMSLPAIIAGRYVVGAYKLETMAQAIQWCQTRAVAIIAVSI
jgi:hypothetical protein